MALAYLHTLLDKAALAQQERWFGKSYRLPSGPGRDPLTADEREFIARRDSLYIASVNADGWPYMQHRGGERGFVEVLGDHALVIPDYPGNRQLITTGNLQGSDRVSLFFMDYPSRARLKILGHARIQDSRPPGLKGQPVQRSADVPLAERWILVDVVGFDWNCPRYITPRYTAEEIEVASRALTDRVEALEAENERLRLQLAGTRGERQM